MDPGGSENTNFEHFRAMAAKWALEAAWMLVLNIFQCLPKIELKKQNQQDSNKNSNKLKQNLKQNSNNNSYFL